MCAERTHGLSKLKRWRACLRHTPYSRLVLSLGWETQHFTVFVGLRLWLIQSTLVALSGSLLWLPESFLMIGKDASVLVYQFAKRFQVAVR